MTLSTHILVIDDDEIMRDSSKKVLMGDKYQVEVASNGEEGLRKMQDAYYDIVILDLKMPGLGGLEVLKRIKTDNPDILVIVITGFATVNSAVEAMKLGAYDFLPKPFNPDELRVVVHRAMEKRSLIRENLYLQQELEAVFQSNHIIGQSPVMKDIAALIKKVSHTGSTVLITGESGTGKELVARDIHNRSQRKAMPFVTVDCSTLVENLFESELFGHVKGSFTGATATKHGRLELANGGTVFFDEVGNISPAVQAKLLRAIQEREITKVGSTQSVKIDIRIVAATNKDLLQAVKNESFREDLYYRLSVVPIHLPPLRDRKEDIPPLAEHFLQKYNRKRRKSVKGFDEKTMKALLSYDWPGNIRELENTIERAIVLTESEYLEPFDLHTHGLSSHTEEIKERSLDEVEKEHIIKTLRLYNNQKHKTADALGIDRKTLRLKMRKYKLEV